MAGLKCSRRDKGNRVKLATLRNGTRDGQLVVVSRDLTKYTDASFLVPTLQAALDNWARVSPHLAAMAQSLEVGSVPSLRFHEHDAESPLPRAYLLAFASEAGGLVHAASDSFFAPRDPVRLEGGAALGHRAGVAVILDDVGAGADKAEAGEAISLVMLVNDLVVDGHGRLSSAFSPVAVTPDELGDAWGARGLPFSMEVNGQPSPDSGPAAALGFPALVEQAARLRPLGAGAILGRHAAEGVSTLKPGDTVRIEMKDSRGHSIFGAIEQTAEPLES